MQFEGVIHGHALRAILGVAVLAGATASAGAQGLIWTHQSVGSSWLAEAVTLGGGGEHVFTEVGAYANNRLLFSAYDTSPPEPVWSDDELTYNFERRVDSAARADVQVSMHQRYVATGSSARHAVLRKFRSDSPDPDWVHEFPTTIYSHPYADVRISEDGSRIVAALLDDTTGRPALWTFDSSSPTPLSTRLVNSIYSWVTFDLSADGSTVVLSNSQRIVVVDLDGGAPDQQIWIAGQPNHGSLAVSADGSRVVFGTTGKVVLHERQASGAYAPAGTHLLDASDYAASVAISADGSTVAVGINRMGDAAHARILRLAAAGMTATSSYSVPSGGTLQNLVRHIALSEDGRVLAAGLWGDEQGLSPEVLVFEGAGAAPTVAHHLPGSVADLDLDPSGARLAVASKSVHATVTGGGGSFSLFETTSSDLRLSGVPSAGATVRFGLEAPAGTPTRLLRSSGLAAQPRVFGGVGTLVLDEGSLQLLPGFSVADGNGVAKHDHTIPGGAAQIGTTYYFQGLGLRPRALSADHVKMTVLP